MIVLISPAKSQKFVKLENVSNTTQPIFKENISEIIKRLKLYTDEELGSLMKISKTLSENLYSNIQKFDSKNYSFDNALQAISVFNGSVYKGLDTKSLNGKNIAYAQDRLLIISGLYGLIRPLDMVQPYRLEMGCKFKINDILLYKYWYEILANKINEITKSKNEEIIINLASNEYTSAINKKSVKAQIIDIEFREKRDEDYKIIGVHSKTARGQMARYIIINEIENLADLKEFNAGGYKFNSSLSNTNKLCFTRD